MERSQNLASKPTSQPHSGRHDVYRRVEVKSKTGKRGRSIHKRVWLGSQPDAALLFCPCKGFAMVVAVKSLSRVQLFATPWTAALQASRACSNSCPLSRWCHPTISPLFTLLLLPSVFPSIRVFSNCTCRHGDCQLSWCRWVCHLANMAQSHWKSNLPPSWVYLVQTSSCFSLWSLLLKLRWEELVSIWGDGQKSDTRATTLVTD